MKISESVILRIETTRIVFEALYHCLFNRETLSITEILDSYLRVQASRMPSNSSSEIIHSVKGKLTG
jgi:hypothetical protein